MVKEDILLGLEMGRLEIEPLKSNKNRSQDNSLENVLVTRNNFKKNVLQNKCCCPSVRKQSNIGICKRRMNKILKEPVLRILKCDSSSAVLGTENQHIQNNNIFNSDTLSLCTLVQNCNQLKISSGSSETKSLEKDGVNDIQWWRNDISTTKESKDSRQSNQAGSCSQQALNPPCDVTIDELASYFETLVHIPKKMSSMAEMMYI